MGYHWIRIFEEEGYGGFIKVEKAKEGS